MEVAFNAARSRVSPKRQLSIPRLELCTALTGAQLARLPERELTLGIRQRTLWSDFKSVGMRVAKIQELMSPQARRYVKSEDNPADGITHGKPL